MSSSPQGIENCSEQDGLQYFHSLIHSFIHLTIYWGRYLLSRNCRCGPARLLSWLEHCPVHQNVAGSIPWSRKVWEATDRCFFFILMFLSLSLPLCLSLSLSLPLSLKSINISSGEHLEKRKKEIAGVMGLAKRNSRVPSSDNPL